MTLIEGIITIIASSFGTLFVLFLAFCACEADRKAKSKRMKKSLYSSKK